MASACQDDWSGDRGATLLSFSATSLKDPAYEASNFRGTLHYHQLCTRLSCVRVLKRQIYSTDWSSVTVHSVTYKHEEKTLKVQKRDTHERLQHTQRRFISGKTA